MIELYFSLDVETDGPIAPLHSLRQLGMTAFTLDRCPIAQFSANLLPLPEATEDPETMAWWMGTAERRHTWEVMQINAQAPARVIANLVPWIAELTLQEDARPICCASPAGYDWCFLRYYLLRFYPTGTETIFKHRCFDARSHAMGILGKPYLESGKDGIPQEWLPADIPHNHDAAQDSLEQAFLIQNQMKASIAQRRAAVLSPAYDLAKSYLLETAHAADRP
jgi:hypothetical protein